MTAYSSDQLEHYRVEPSELIVRDAKKPYTRITPGLIVLSVTAVLFVFKDMKPYPGTVLIGTIGLATIVFATWLRYRGRFGLYPETALLFGISLQYFFAPTLSRIVSDDFQRWFGISGIRYAVKDGYPKAMLAVLLFVGVFFLVGSLIPERPTPRNSKGRLTAFMSSKAYWIFILGLIQLWLLIRVTLVATGSFYHIHRSDFQFESATYSGMAQADTGLSIMTIAFMWGGVFSKRFNVSWVIVFTIAEFGWNFISGSRGRTAAVFLAIIVTYIVYARRIPWKAIIISSLPMLFLLGFMDHYRYAIRNYAQKDSISFAAIFRALEVSVERADIEGKQTTAERALARLNDLDSVAAITLWTPEIQPYLNGETYALIPAGLVPRALWPDKPVIIRPINEWFFRNEGGSSPITIVGEGYLNFGWFGVIFAGAGAALLLRSVDRYISRFAGNAAVVPVYIAFMAACAQVQNAAAVIWITTFLKFAFFATVVHLLTRPKVMPQFNDPVQLPQVQH